MSGGALLVDKPAGPTSHDVVAATRRALKTSRVGHTGTLDPLATGLLVLLLGPATRLAQFIAADEKEYLAAVRLGTATPTYDAASLGETPAGEGAPPAARPSSQAIEAALAHFRGTFLQTPPPFSAKKIAGVPAHEHARKQRPLDLAPVEVTVRSLELLPSSDPPSEGLLTLRVVASAGFYVRSLAHDLGQRLGCGAYLEALRRTRAGRFSIDHALSLESLVTDPEGSARRIIPPGELLGDLPSATLNAKGLIRVAHGNPLSPDHLTEAPRGVRKGQTVRVFDGLELTAVARVAGDGSLQPIVVLGGAPEVKY